MINTSTLNIQTSIDTIPFSQRGVSIDNGNEQLFDHVETFAFAQTALRQNIKEYYNREYERLAIDLKEPIKIVKPRFSSRNDVYVISFTAKDHTHKQTAIASYLKFPSVQPGALSTLECLMWKISKFMQVEEFFVRTQVKLSTSGPLGTKNGAQTYSVSQPAIKGLTLHDCLADHPGKLPHTSSLELAKAVFVSILFGMFDAHAKNIVIMDDGRIRFVDNAQSMPNSNGFIAWEDVNNIRSSYRCALLMLDSAREPTTAEVREELLLLARRCQKQIEKLPAMIKGFFDRSRNKYLIADLPNSWFEQDKALASMKERLDLVESVLTSTAMFSLVDLASKGNPRYPLAFGIEFLAFLSMEKSADNSFDELLKCAHLFHNKITIPLASVRISQLAFLGHDLSEIVDLCEDGSDFTSVIERVIGYFFEFRKSASIFDRPIKQSFFPLERIRRGIALDLKECDEESQRFSENLKENIEQLSRIGIPTILIAQYSFEILDIPYKEFVFFVIKDYKSHMIIRTRFGLAIGEIEIAKNKCKLGYYCDIQNSIQTMIISSENIEKLRNMELGKSFNLINHLPENHSFDLFKYGNKIHVTYEEDSLIVHRQASSGSVEIREFDFVRLETELITRGKPATFNSVIEQAEKNFLS